MSFHHRYAMRGFFNSEVNHIMTNIAAAYVAAAEKNAEMPELQNSENLAATILSIPVYEESTPEPGVPVAVIGEREYSSVYDALTVAADGDTVKLISDAAETECVSIPEGVTLDLNGYALTANYMLGVGHLVDDSTDNTGAVSAAHIKLRKDNRQLPVYDPTANGYRFFEVTKYNQLIQESDGRFAYQVFFENPSSRALLQNGRDVSGVTIAVRAYWMTDEPSTVQFFILSDASTKTFLNSYNESTGKYTTTLFCTFNDSAYLSGKEFSVGVISTTGVEIWSTPISLN